MTETAPLCVNHGGPNVPTPFCQCSTTTGGQIFFVTVPTLTGQCADYTSFPSAVTLAPTTTPAPDPTPFVTTEDSGEIISYPDQTVEYNSVYSGVTVTKTVGVGTPSTVQPATPSQTKSNHSGSSQCHSIDDACDRAVEQYEDDLVYRDYTAYTAKIHSGIIMAATFGKAGCTAMFTCDNYDDGMSGRNIKAA